MANPGYGKRSAPDQHPRTRHDFALFPVRERYVAGFVDHLPEGAAMSVKQLAKQLPLYGQQAISTSLSALSIAGHLRRVRCPVGDGEQVRWVYRTFWSRTARDNEWWNTYLTTENAAQSAAPTGLGAPSSDAAPPPWAPAEESSSSSPSETPAADQAPETTTAPQERAPQQAPEAHRLQGSEPEPSTRDMAHAKPTRSAEHASRARDVAPTPPAPAALRAFPEPAAPSPAYLALARLGRDDHRLALSAADCAALEPLATQWLARGVGIDYLTSALTAGLPAQVDSPAGLLRRRLTDKMPPYFPIAEPTPTNASAPAPARRILIECTHCGRPGRPEALPDGLCRPCHHTHTGSSETTPTPTEIAAVKAHMANLRTLLKPV
ncbi:MarR family transcriptional regulator [Streptomyces sp. NBC_01178]|uniref:MarR family transcriptional regulator n=1 Tax=Streptomyces sp. NBC_01178 TaxID=2903762 RepID=UPI003863AE1B|nr:MarR family transcriptional regulator [Streptomyces sp. NBC_01178]